MSTAIQYQQSQANNLQSQINNLAQLYQQQVKNTMYPMLQVSTPSGYPLKASSMGFSSLVSAATVAMPGAFSIGQSPNYMGILRTDNAEWAKSLKIARGESLKRYMKSSGL